MKATPRPYVPLGRGSTRRTTPHTATHGAGVHERGSVVRRTTAHSFAPTAPRHGSRIESPPALKSSSIVSISNASLLASIPTPAQGRARRAADTVTAPLWKAPHRPPPMHV